MSAELDWDNSGKSSCTEPFDVLRSPQEEAATLFANAVQENLMLLGVAEMEATNALQRVIPAFIKEGSEAWKRFSNEHSVLRHYQKGLELVRLFLTYDQVTDNKTIQREFYEPVRMQVVEVFVRSIVDLPVSSIREVYQHIGLQPRRDRIFANHQYAIARRTRILQ